MEQQALRDLFEERARSVTAVVQGRPDLAGALAYAVELTREQGGGEIAAPGLEEAWASQLESLCAEAGIRLLREGLRDQGQGFHTGLCLAQWGIADTGTLVIDSTSEELRLATMLCEVQVAILPAAGIRPDLAALAPELEEFMSRSPHYLAFISGPSRTADIELSLTVGAHGPGQVHVIILEQ